MAEEKEVKNEKKKENLSKSIIFNVYIIYFSCWVKSVLSLKIIHHIALNCWLDHFFCNSDIP